MDPHDIDIAFVGNAYAGLTTGQESVRGQVIMREAGITGIPIINVENACASGSTAFYLAYRAVASGEANLALAIGAEKLFCGDTGKSLQALSTSTDLGIEGKMGMLFAGIYAMRVRRTWRSTASPGATGFRRGEEPFPRLAESPFPVPETDGRWRRSSLRG